MKDVLDMLNKPINGNNHGNTRDGEGGPPRYDKKQAKRARLKRKMEVFLQRIKNANSGYEQAGAIRVARNNVLLALNPDENGEPPEELDPDESEEKKTEEDGGESSYLDPEDDTARKARTFKRSKADKTIAKPAPEAPAPEEIKEAKNQATEIALNIDSAKDDRAKIQKEIDEYLAFKYGDTETQKTKDYKNLNLVERRRMHKQFLENLDKRFLLDKNIRKLNKAYEKLTGKPYEGEAKKQNIIKETFGAIKAEQEQKEEIRRSVSRKLGEKLGKNPESVNMKDARQYIVAMNATYRLLKERDKLLDHYVDLLGDEYNPDNEHKKSLIATRLKKIMEEYQEDAKDIDEGFLNFEKTVKDPGSFMFNSLQDARESFYRVGSKEAKKELDDALKGFEEAIQELEKAFPDICKKEKAKNLKRDKATIKALTNVKRKSLRHIFG